MRGRARPHLRGHRPAGKSCGNTSTRSWRAAGYGVGGSLSGLANSVFRAHRYGYDHPALQGKDLDPDNYANINRLYA